MVKNKTQLRRVIRKQKIMKPEVMISENFQKDILWKKKRKIKMTCMVKW